MYIVVVTSGDDKDADVNYTIQNLVRLNSGELSEIR